MPRLRLSSLFLPRKWEVGLRAPGSGLQERIETRGRKPCRGVVHQARPNKTIHRLFFPLLLAISLQLSAISLAQKPGQTFALVVGINNYRPYQDTPPMPPLSFAESDARKVAAALKVSRSGTPIVHSLYDDAATHTAILAEVRGLARRMGPNDTFIFYFSGHGIPNSQGQAALIPSDGKTDDEETWLPLPGIQALVSQISNGQGHVMLILDACFSGKTEPGSRSFAVPGRKAVPDVTGPIVEANSAVLASSDGNQPSWEDKDLEGGVFTNFLLEALRQGDADGDGRVTLEETYAFVAPRVEENSRQRGKLQTPRLYGPNDLILALNSNAVSKGRLAQLKVSGLINGDSFDALVNWVDQAKQPEDMLHYLNGQLDEKGFLLLVKSGAIAGVKAETPDKRLAKIGLLRRTRQIRRDQFFAISLMIQQGKAPEDVSDYLAGRLSEARFLQRVRAGAIKGLSR